MYVVYKDMMKWCQRVIDCRKMNVNKVSDSFDTCRRHCFLILDELERLSIDVFIEETVPASSSDHAKTVDIALQYNKFISTRESTDDRRKYMFGYIIIASESRKYWTDVWCSDRIVMENT